MNYAQAFELITKKFGQAGIRYVLIGGFAVNYYKVLRATADVDLMLAADDLDKAARILEDAGYQRKNSTKAFAQFQSRDIRAIDIDLILVDRKTLDGVLEEAVEAEIAGWTMYLPSLMHLMVLKIHAMKNNPKGRSLRDLADVIDLLKTHGINPQEASFRTLCLEYGTEEIYRSITEQSK